ncbi:MAG: gamma-glutamyl-gamma-aminobutyrate hydrolase family protein, partial [Proteobacteria bacterium]|nr:gamma-glutamyl-gamma-aminobutyrate hydrolase family protein [Pseudomonadota bacterium]
RGVEGKIAAIRYAREKKIPFYGICLGMQLAVVEFARHVCGLEKANSLEFDTSTPDPVINLMEEQKAVHNLGGTMRLGAYDCMLEKNSKSHSAYGEREISERHRHRYEYNSEYAEVLVKHGLRTVGTDRRTGLVEIVELDSHPWFVGCQFHPEFKSRPMSPHPLFASFIEAAAAFAKRRLWESQKESSSPAKAAQGAKQRKASVS